MHSRSLEWRLGVVAAFTLVAGAALAEDGLSLRSVSDWLGVIGTGGTIALAVLALWLKDKFASQGALAKLEQRLDIVNARVDGVEARMSRTEQEVHHLPNKEATHALELALSDLKGEVRGLTSQLGPMAATSRRLEEYLLEVRRS